MKEQNDGEEIKHQHIIIMISLLGIMQKQSRQILCTNERSLCTNNNNNNNKDRGIKSQIINAITYNVHYQRH